MATENQQQKILCNRHNFVFGCQVLRSRTYNEEKALKNENNFEKLLTSYLVIFCSISIYVLLS